MAKQTKLEIWAQSATEQDWEAIRQEAEAAKSKAQKETFFNKYGFSTAGVLGRIKNKEDMSSLTQEFETKLQAQEAEYRKELETMKENQEAAIKAAVAEKDAEIKKLKKTIRELRSKKIEALPFENGNYKKVCINLTESSYKALLDVSDKISKETCREKRCCMSALIAEAVRRYTGEEDN